MAAHTPLTMLSRFGGSGVVKQRPVGAGSRPADFDFAPRTRRGIPPALFYGLSGLLMLTNALAVGALLMSPDIARLMHGQQDTILAAYENRMTELRVEVDRLHSRNYAQAGDLNLQLQELSQQQELLAEQHELVRILVGKAGELGIAAATISGEIGAEVQTVSGLRLPETGNASVDATARAIGDMMLESRLAIASISAEATDRTDVIVTELRGLGIDVPLPEPAGNAVGGPLLPPVDEAMATDLVDNANAVMAALYRYQAAKGALASAPVHMPITAPYRQSSNFGNRKDPFTGGRAFHAGLDFAAASGTAVFAAGSGTVTFAGRRSGYGNVVEITHGNGLVTRYAHLSAILVNRGEAVATGDRIAKVGSTGRSTGPHLHFEVRKANAPIDPKDFLESGKRLAGVL
jgi:murein DD-endopeptidase MepM/ murein hydrolase activator NlpD